MRRRESSAYWLFGKRSRIVWNAWNDLRASIGGRSDRSALNQRSRKFGLRSNCVRPLM